MSGARAAEQKCSYEGQTRAAGDYLNAADHYDAAGQPGKAAAARALAKRANARSYSCERAQRAAQQKASQCDSFRRQMAEAKARHDLRAIMRLSLRPPSGC